MRSLLLRLYNLAHHPGALERLSYAFALNSTYRALREDLPTLDAHLLELVYHTVFALRLAQDDPPELGTADALVQAIGRNGRARPPSLSYFALLYFTTSAIRARYTSIAASPG